MSSREKESLMSSGGKNVKRYTEEKECYVSLVEVEPGKESSKTEEGMSWYKAMFLTMNAALGAGLLNFPRAFDEAGGIVSGNQLLVIITALALGSLLVIAKCATERNCKTYQELILHMWGSRMSAVVSVCIAAYCIVTCITFLIIIGDQFDRAFASFVGADFCSHWYMDRKFVITASSILLIFPCCLKKIEDLRFMSYVGVLTVFYLTAVIITEFYFGNYKRGPVIVNDVDWIQMFNVMPTLCFGYQCHISSVPIYSSLKPSHSKLFTKACIVAISVCLLVYTVSANYGYLTFGSLVNADILLSYEARHPYVLVAVVLLAVKSWTTYPIMMFCVREAVKDMYMGMVSMPETQIKKGEGRRRKVIAIILWASTVMLAVFTPNIGVVMKLLGCLSALFIFVFPGLCLLKIAGDAPSRKLTLELYKHRATLILGCIYVVVGTFAFALALALGLKSIVHPNMPVPVCV